MYLLKSFCKLGRLSVRISTKKTFCVCKNLKLPIKNNVSPRFNFKSPSENDILLFTSNKARFFLLLNGLSLMQCVFWVHLGYFVCFTMKNYEINSEYKFWNWFIIKEQKHRRILATIAALFGVTFFAATCLYTARSVRSLTLNKGGKKLTVITYKIPGIENILEVPLSEISALSSRKKAKNSLVLKIKNKAFYYLLDLNGDFKDPSLFDSTAGIQRNF